MVFQQPAKARVRQSDAHLISPVEFRLKEEPTGSYVWTYANLKKTSKAEVIRMLDEGISATKIAKKLNLTKGRVSQIKDQAVRDELITEVGKLTQSGFSFLQNSD